MTQQHSTDKMKPSTPGRPTLLTDEVQQTIVSNLSSCAHRSVAAACAGIGKRTFVTWMRKGRERPKSRYGAFRHAILEAEKKAEMRLSALIAREAAKDPKQAQWMLTHRFPTRWGERRRMEISGRPGKPVELSLRERREDLIRRIDRIAAMHQQAPPEESSDATDNVDTAT